MSDTALTIDDVRTAIEADGRADWRAADTPLLRAMNTAGSISGLFGMKAPDPSNWLRPAAKGIFETASAPPPPRVDWHADGHVLPVVDQSGCGACVAFATCAAMESSVSISQDRKLPLSPGHLFHCNGGDCDEGWDLAFGLQVAKGGVALEADHPWSDDGVCRKAGPAVAVSEIRSAFDLEARKHAVAKGPVLAGMRVYADLFAYQSGIYRHVAGEEQGLHAVCVMGYDDVEECWMVKNSWGTGFGEDGFFRIAYGDCDIDGAFPFYSVSCR